MASKFGITGPADHSKLVKDLIKLAILETLAQFTKLRLDSMDPTRMVQPVVLLIFLCTTALQDHRSDFIYRLLNRGTEFLGLHRLRSPKS